MRTAKYGREEAKDAARERLRGIITAPCLPVHQDGSVNEAGLRHDVRHCIDVTKSAGLYIHGYYGHFWLLTSEQRRRVIEVVIDEVAGAVPVICRCAHPSPAEALALARHAQEVGADFISLVSPQFGGASDDIVLGYVGMIANEIDLGITIFNTTQAGYQISPELMARLADIPNVCALKNGMEMSHTNRIRELVGDRIVVVDPEEENLLVNMLEHGQQAIYTGTNMMYDGPDAQPMRAYVEAALAGRRDEAIRLYHAMDDARALHHKWVLEPWQSTGLCPISTVKFWSRQMGMTGGPVPTPLPELPPDQQELLMAELAALRDRT